MKMHVVSNLVFFLLYRNSCLHTQY